MVALRKRHGVPSFIRPFQLRLFGLGKKGASAGVPKREYFKLHNDEDAQKQLTDHGVVDLSSL
jgi:hypothetical protein